MITARICDQQNGELGVNLHSSNPDPVMSALGQKQALRHLQPMSALPPKADIAEGDRHVRFVPKADSCTAAKRSVIQSPRRRERAASAEYRHLSLWLFSN